MGQKLIFDPETGELLVSETLTKSPFSLGGQSLAKGDDGTPASRIYPELARALESGNSRFQQDTLEMLAAAGPAYVSLFPLVIPYLKATDPELQKSAEKALVRLGFDLASRNSISTLLQGEDNDLRLRLIKLCTFWGQQARGLSQSLAKLLGDDCTRIREAASKALAATGFHASALPIVERLMRHGNEMQRIALLQTLAGCAGTATSALPMVVSRLNDKNGRVVAGAAQAFRQIGFHASSYKEIQRILGHAEAERRCLMLELLADAGIKAVITAPIVFPLIADDDERVKRLAWRALDALGYNDGLLKPME